MNSNFTSSDNISKSLKGCVMLSNEDKHKYTNKLIQEKSPYLLQHTHNPVDWYPWGGEAFARAVAEDKPIFLSIGYSTCHWCHVMERESFEDEEVARLLNKDFIAIKVDREERPDIDHIYMSVCQALTGHGGWPLTIIMTPDKKPFFAGTYFPKTTRMGHTGIIEVLEALRDTWHKEKDKLQDASRQIMQHVEQDFEADNHGDLTMKDVDRTFKAFLDSFDDNHGGFGSEPKFPTPHNLMFLLRYWKFSSNNDALKMVEKTLESMYSGGIFDHIGFGFSRYSTDGKWLVPHFEKMLYDNALLAIAYLEAYQATGKTLYAEVAERIFEYVLRDMTSQDGGFFSAEDADSEGEEGKYYVWSVEEIKEILGEEDGKRYCKLYNITEKGNFEGKSIPNLIENQLLDEDKRFVEACRERLFIHREKRVRPFKDDKILTAWNGLMIAAMAIGGRVLHQEKYTKAAQRAMDFVFHRLMSANGRLMARYRDGEAAYLGYVDDYAFVIWGLLELYETSYKPEYLKKALDINQQLMDLFWDKDKGGLFIYGHDAEQLITRPKEVYDGATPSGNSVAAYNFIRLARLTGDADLEDIAIRHIEGLSNIVSSHPHGYSFFMMAVLTSLVRTKEVVLVDNKLSSSITDMIRAIHEEYNPFTTSLLYSNEYERLKEYAPYVADYKTVNDKATAYVCENYTCQAPTNDVNSLREALRS